MKDRFIAFDVETPNHNNDRMSAIGVTVVENGGVVDEFYSLVDPEVEFDGFNIALTGITPELVRDAPTFPVLWKELAPVMGSGLLTAHSAPFDLGVLAKCLSAYEVDWQPYAYYACTCVMGRDCYPELPNHKLNTLCGYLGVSLDHHNAGSDSRACAELLMNYMRRGLRVDDYIRRYDFTAMRSQRLPHPVRRSYSSEQLLKLKALLGSVTADNRLSAIEVSALQSWLEQNTFLRGSFPFDKVFGTVSGALEDGVLESGELADMLSLFEQLSDPVTAAEPCGCFDIAGKIFCLTGEFDCAPRAAVEAALIKKGGIPVSGVTRKTDYVIVGGKGSEAWSAGNYGSKIKKALELREKGAAVEIVREVDIAGLLS